MEQFSQIKETILPVLINYGLQVAGGILILVVGWGIAQWLSKRVEKYTKRSKKIDNTLVPFLVKGTKILLIVITLLIVLHQFGIKTTSFIALLGTIGLAIGLALQGTLSNVAAGVMLLCLRPFRVGDEVDVSNGTVGIIDEIGLFVTEMHTYDNIAVTMPNSVIWGQKIRNLSRNPTRRVDMEFGIDYENSIEKAMGIIREELNKDERVLAQPEPLIAVGTLADSSVNIRVRPWAKTPDIWSLRYDMTKQIKERFDEEGISIPFPQRFIHLSSDDPNSINNSKDSK